MERGTRKGLRFFLGFSWAFAPVAPRSLTCKPTYNKTCNPTYNPSYCPHTSDVARGGTAVGTFCTAEPWSRKRDSERKERKKLKKVVKVDKELKKVVKVDKEL